jgi:hypothetical protein
VSLTIAQMAEAFSGHRVIDSRATYVDAENTSFAVASCDIYEFVDGALAEITSYNVELG